MNDSRRFHMTRHVDHTGTSGIGVVAEGVEFSDGTVVIRWRPVPATSTAIYASVDELLTIHGHGGDTTVEWLDTAPVEPELVPCPNGLHDPQECDEDGYPNYDGCPDCDALAGDNSLTHSEVAKAAAWVHAEGITIGEAIGRAVEEARRM
jgi:hypothetical protein